MSDSIERTKILVFTRENRICYVITDDEIPNNVIICAQPDFVVKLYAQQNWNPFEEL